MHSPAMPLVDPCTGRPLGNTSTSTSAIFDYDRTHITFISFGTDSSLTITPGWDNVTGWGTIDMGAISILFE